MKSRLIKLLLLTQIPIHVSAGGEKNINPISSSESEYISQSDVTRENYNMMSEFGTAYDECLTESAHIEVPNYNDPRHVVDVAMKQCAVKLEELNAWFIEKRYPPDFIKRHIKKLSSGSVRQIMPKIMFMMSTKQ